MSTRHLDLAVLRTFIAVAETGRMTSAAARVRRSQGAISQQIRRLEEQLGCPLFQRGSPLRVTRGGERLLARAHQLLRLNDETLSSVQRADFVGEVRLGVAYDIVRSLLPTALRSFRMANPAVRIVLTSEASQILLDKLARNELDATITTDRVAMVGAVTLMKSRLIWAGAARGEAHRLRPLSVALGDERCAFRNSAVEALSRSGLDWRPICQAGGLEAVFTTLEADCAIAPLLSCAVPKSLVRLRDRRLPPLPEFHIALRIAQGAASPMVSALKESIQRSIFKSKR